MRDELLRMVHGLSKKSQIFLIVVVPILIVGSSSTNAQDRMGKVKPFSRLELQTDLGIDYLIPGTLFKGDTVNIKSNESIPERIYSNDTSTVDTNVVIVKQKSALTAVLLSTVIPGGGQIYNGSYWKVPHHLCYTRFFCFSMDLE